MDRINSAKTKPMTKTFMRELLDAKMWEWGKSGCTYDWYIQEHHGSAHIEYTKSEILKEVGDGAIVTIEAFKKGNNRYYWDGDFVDSLVVKIEDTPKNRDSIRRHKEYKKYRAKTRDQQRSKVYNWERELEQLLGNKELTKQETYDLYKEVFSLFGLDCPNIEITNQKKTRCTSYGDGSIRVAESWGCTVTTTLHEASHSILKLLGWRGIQGHGAEFVSLYMELLELYLDYDRTVMEAYALRDKVKFIKDFDVFKVKEGL